MAAAKGDTVKVHYTGKLDDETVFDSTRDGEPFQFTLDADEVIPGFEHAVVGLEPGERTETRIAPNDAYGPHREDLLITLPRDTLPSAYEPEIGISVQLRRAEGSMEEAVIAEFSDTEVMFDANHPLAGEHLNFEIELVEVL